MTTANLNGQETEVRRIAIAPALNNIPMNT